MDCNHGFSLAKLASPLITACTGLGGVALGGATTIWSQRRERRSARIREQLDKFYAPLLGMRMQILAKSEVRQKVSGIAGAAWASLFAKADDPEARKKIDSERWPAFEELIEYSEQHMREELVPLYRQMVALFADNMQFAEDSTRKHFGTLVEFTELWNRALQNPIPPEVLSSLNHSEKALYPFYEDLETQFRKLRKQVK
jgi:hypothetical protein